MNIVAIGGGELRSRETFEIDTFIRDLSGKSAPKVLFIPTASNDAAGYCEVFSEVYGKELGCSVNDLRLMTQQPGKNEIEDKLFNADVIYVGGGNTKNMLEVWEKNNLNTLLAQIADSGTILSGLSAGAICWFEKGHSDYELFENENNWQYRFLNCLGFKSGIYCPHLNEDSRLSDFTASLQQQKLNGIGCDNNAAIWYQNNNAKVITSSSEATVKVINTELEQTTCKIYSAGETIHY